MIMVTVVKKNCFLLHFSLAQSTSMFSPFTVHSVSTVQALQLIACHWWLLALQLPYRSIFKSISQSINKRLQWKKEKIFINQQAKTNNLPNHRIQWLSTECDCLWECVAFGAHGKWKHFVIGKMIKSFFVLILLLFLRATEQISEFFFG